MSVRGYIELEWQIPWEADWSNTKKRAAADKLVSYLRDGTVLDVEKRRLPLQNVEVKQANANDSSCIVFRLEL